MANSSTDWIAVVILVTMWCITGNALYCFYRLRKVHAIEKRLPNIIIIVGILSFTYLTLNILILLLVEQIWIIENGYNSLIYSAFFIFGTSEMYILSYRAFRLYFDAQFNHYLQDTEWRLFIDPNEKNWFLKNKTTWGNGRKFAICLIINYLLFAIIGMHHALTTGVDSTARFMLVFASITPLLINIFIFYKYPVFEDAYYVRTEIKISTLFICVLLISYSVIVSAIHTQDKDPHATSPVYLLFFFMGNFVVIIPILISILLILIKFKLPWNVWTVCKYFQDIDCIDNVINEEQNNQMRLSLIDILQNEIGFSSFARHLAKQFCIENLLFFIETSQFIEYVLAKIRLEQEQYIYDDSNLWILFPENAPKSEIIHSLHQKRTTRSVLVGTGFLDDEIEYNNNEKHENSNDENVVDESYLFAVKIFLKYIVHRAYFCINISSDEQYGLYSIFRYIDSIDIPEKDMAKNLSENKVNLKELIHVFDGSRFATFKLMLNGFSRFKMSDEFAKVNDVIQQ
eukprot:119731_1